MPQTHGLWTRVEAFVVLNRVKFSLGKVPGGCGSGRRYARLSIVKALVSGPDVRRLAHSPMRTREEDLVRALQRTV